uniref:WGR domain-containing protein n=1 Tax=Thomasclavelia cocleata TaxID=69824 RepID=UPI00256F5402
ELKYLVMVTTANNNKFYKMIPHGNTFTAEYGRLGNDSFQTKEYPISKFESVYRSKIAKGYEDKTELIQEAIEIEKPKNKEENQYKPIPDSVVAIIVDRLQQMAKKTIEANYKVKASVVTNAMIKEAQGCLNKLSSIKTVPTFNKYLLELFAILPRKMKNVNDFLATSTSEFGDILSKEQDLLDVMAGQVLTHNATKEQETTEVSLDSEKKTILETLGIKMEQTSDEEKEHIKKMLGSIAPRFKNAWRVTNIETQEKFDNYRKEIGENKEIKELWHGSRNENWWSIITNGLVLRPTNAVISGKMFGYGIYFAPKAAKSIGYTSTYGARWTNGGSSSGFLSIYDVIYGDPYIIDKNYYTYNGLNLLDYNSLQQRKKGADSLHALREVTGLREDEIIVYKEEQATIKYLVEVSS